MEKECNEAVHAGAGRYPSHVVGVEERFEG